MRAKRKTLAETKAEYRSYGFCEAHDLVADIIREDFWKRLGASRWRADIDERHQALLEILLLLSKRTSELDTEYKKLMIPRVYGVKY